MKYGYIRVSTEEQNLDRQIITMREQGIPEDNVYMDKASGKNMEREGWNRLLPILAAGDELIIDSLDRLGRNYDELVDMWKYLTRKLGCDVKALDIEFFDSKMFKQMGDVGKCVEDMLLALLAYVSETERKKIVQRTKEGVAVAKAKGKMKGKQPKKFDNDTLEKAQLALQSDGKVAASRVLGVTRQTIYRMINEGRLTA